MSLVPVDTSSAIAVSDYLSKARDWLATAVEMTGPEQIAMAKAEIATAAEATKQLGLSKEIQLDAQEMVRRAEYALGKAIRKGQEDGTIVKRGTLGNGRSAMGADLLRPTDFATDAELHGNPTLGRPGILQLAQADESEIDAALTEAKAEGNLSRTNVVRKITGASEGKETRESRASRVAELASRGWTSHQIAKEIGIGREAVVSIAHDFDIAITADVVRGNVRRFNHNRVLDNVTESLEVAAMSLRDVDPAQLDKEQAAERLDSLTASISALSKAVKKIKESFRD